MAPLNDPVMRRTGNLTEDGRPEIVPADVAVPLKGGPLDGRTIHQPKQVREITQRDKEGKEHRYIRNGDCYEYQA